MYQIIETNSIGKRIVLYKTMERAYPDSVTPNVTLWLSTVNVPPTCMDESNKERREYKDYRLINLGQSNVERHI